MSNTDVHISAALAPRAATAAFSPFLVAARFLVFFGFRGRRNGPVHNRSYRLPLNHGQNGDGGLRRGRGRSCNGNRNGRYLDHGLTPQKDHGPMLNILLHNCNEESVNHFMFKYILGKFNFAGLYLGPQLLGGAL